MVGNNRSVGGGAPMCHAVSHVRALWVLVTFCSLVPLASLGGSGCGPLGGGDAAGIVAGDGSRRGELQVYVSDDFEGRTETRYALRDGRGDERTLIFESAPAFAPGAAIHVWGS